MYKRAKTPPKTFNSLSISNFNQRWSEEGLKDHLYKEFRRFGEYHIELSRDFHGEKKAVANFRYFEDAMAVRSAFKSKSLDIDPNIIIEPVYEDSSRQRRTEHFGRSLKNDKAFLDDSEDKNATRTLFIGNLDFDIRAEELQMVFGQFGYIEDIDIKKSNGHMGGSVYAFIRFLNLEMAQHAKYEMSGKLIGKHNCRIGYGKHVPSNCLWVGNIGPNVSREDLEKCFASFNPVKIHWSHGRQFAYIVFSSLEVASSVLNSMQAFEIFPGNHLRLDFSDENHLSMLINKDNATQNKQKCLSIFNSVPPSLKSLLSESTSISSITKHLQHVWTKEITLGTSIFNVHFHLLCGSVQLVDDFMNSQNIPIQKKISSQDLILNELESYVQADNSDCTLMMMTQNEKNTDSGNNFSHVFSYFIKKQIVGLTTLPLNSTNIQAVIHWMNHGATYKRLLGILCPKLVTEELKENIFLVILNTVKL